MLLMSFDLEFLENLKISIYLAEWILKDRTNRTHKSLEKFMVQRLLN